MNQDIIKSNADILWNCTGRSILTVNTEYRLLVISNWNLIGRFFKWIIDWYLNGGVTARIHKAAEKTLQEIMKSNSSNNPKQLVYVRDKEYSWGFNTAMYSPNYPSYMLSDRISKNPQFSNLAGITTLANQLANQSNLFPFSRSVSLITPTPTTKVLDWDEVP